MSAPGGEQLQASEALRQAYLQAIGVDCWLPTRPLPGAAPSPDWSWEVRAPSPSPRAPSGSGEQPSSRRPGPGVREAADQARRDARAALAADLTGLGAPAPRQAVPADKPAVMSPPAASPARPAANRASAEVPRFALSMLVYEDALICVELPPAAGGGLGPEHRRLLQNILRALGRPAGEPLAEERLRWPLFENSFVDMSEPVARAAVAERVAQLSRGRSLDWALLFGQQAARFVLGDEGGGEEPPWGQPKPLAGGITALATLSLHQALAVPACKADIWRHLQPVRR